MTRKINNTGVRNSDRILQLHQKMIDDLEKTFEKALKAEQYTAAIRAKELQLRELMQISDTIQKQIKKISEMDEEELKHLIST